MSSPASVGVGGARSEDRAPVWASPREATISGFRPGVVDAHRQTDTRPGASVVAVAAGFGREWLDPR